MCRGMHAMDGLMSGSSEGLLFVTLWSPCQHVAFAHIANISSHLSRALLLVAYLSDIYV